MRKPCRIVTLALLALATFACATPEALKRAEQEVARGNYDAAVAYYRDLVDQDPDNVKYRIGLERALFDASQQHEAIARALRADGALEEALREYQLAAQLDPGNQVALTGLQHVQEELAEIGDEPPTLTRLEELTRQANAMTPPLPVLQPQTAERVSLTFVDSEIQVIYTTLARIGGLSVLFDAQLQPETTDIELNNVTVAEALDWITRSRGHFYKAMSPSVFVVAPDNANKRRMYADQVMRTFFLSNASAEDVGPRLQEMLEIQGVSTDAELNAITIRATPEVVALAERVVTVADKARGELMLNIEILEVNRRLLREYGISLTDYTVTQSLAQGEAGISVNDLRFINAADWFVTLPSIRYRLFKETGDFKLVANPDMRVTEGEEASLIIGEQVPIVTTVYNPGQLAGNQVVPIRSTEYRDVGIVLGANARVHHNDEVTLDLSIEVSSVTGTSTIEDLPIFATRNVISVLRLRDGETNVLAGLLQDAERTSLRGIPGLVDVPVLRSLFGSNSDEITQTDVILTITPHILQAPDITLDDLMSTYVGTAAAIGGAPAAVGGVPGAMPQPSGSARPDNVTPLQPAPEEQSATAEATEPRQAGVTSISLQPGQATVQAGEEFVLDVQVDGASELFSAELRVSFDPSVLEYADAASGPLLRETNAETAFQAAPLEPGSVGAGMTRIGGTGGIDGSGTLMSLGFRALTPGVALIDIGTVSLRAADGSPIPVTARGMTVEIVSGSQREENQRAPR